MTFRVERSEGGESPTPRSPRSRSTRTSRPGALLLLLAAACADDPAPPDGGLDPGDAGRTDTATPDGGRPDLDAEAGPADAETPDAEARDAAILDAEGVDSQLRDAEPRDAEPEDLGLRPDARPRDAGPADASPPDVGPDAGPSAGRFVPSPTGACAPLTAANDFTVRWSDAACRARETRLRGAVARHFVRDDGAGPSRSTGGGQYDGMGYVTTHYANTAFVESGESGAAEWVLRGPHHAIYRVSWTRSGGSVGVAGDLRFVVEWSFATGRSHPVYAITYDLSSVPPNAFRGDARTPYGELGFDGDRGGTVSGVGWGDTHRFTTLDPPLTKLNPWDYTQPNAVPYAYEWIDEYDAEMGLVQTQLQTQHAAGGYWFYGSRGTRDADGPMPEDWNWPYQLNQYSFSAGQTTRSTRLAWGLNYGAVGQTAYAAYGDDPDSPPPGSPSGHPFQSYSVLVALGRHSDAVTLAAAEEVARTQAARLTAVEGAVVTALPAGVGETAPRPLAVPGLDPRHLAFAARAAGGRARLRLEAGTPGLTHPTVVVEDTATAPTAVEVDGRPLGLGSEVALSHDAGAARTWLTLLGRVEGTVELTVR